MYRDCWEVMYNVWGGVSVCTERSHSHNLRSTLKCVYEFKCAQAGIYTQCKSSHSHIADEGERHLCDWGQDVGEQRPKRGTEAGIISCLFIICSLVQLRWASWRAAAPQDQYFLFSCARAPQRWYSNFMFFMLGWCGDTLMRFVSVSAMNIHITVHKICRGLEPVWKWTFKKSCKNMQGVNQEGEKGIGVKRLTRALPASSQEHRCYLLHSPAESEPAKQTTTNKEPRGTVRRSLVKALIVIISGFPTCCSHVRRIGRKRRNQASV